MVIDRSPGGTLGLKLGLAMIQSLPPVRRRRPVGGLVWTSSEGDAQKSGCCRQGGVRASLASGWDLLMHGPEQGNAVHTSSRHLHQFDT